MTNEQFMKAVIEHELSIEEMSKFLQILKNNNLYKGE